MFLHDSIFAISSGSSIGIYLGAIMVQGIRIFSQLFGTFLLVRYPRKPIFVASGALTALGLFGLGTVLLLHPADRMSNMFQSPDVSVSSNYSLDSIAERLEPEPVIGVVFR